MTQDGGETNGAHVETADPAGPDVDWDRLYRARILEAALDRVRPEFPPGDWDVFRAVALSLDEAEGGSTWTWLDRPPDLDEVAAQFGRSGPVEVSKLKWKIAKRLREDVLYLADELVVHT